MNYLYGNTPIIPSLRTKYLFQLVLPALFLLLSQELYGQSKPVVPICDCVTYIGNDTYVAKFGYDNQNSKDVTVVANNSALTYNFGQTKKNVNNYFKRGRQYNVFTQEFKSKDKCEWKLVLPNGTIKIVTSSIKSVHCRDTNAGLDPIFNGSNEGGVIWPELYYLAQSPTTTSNEIFQISNDQKVLIEVIAVSESAAVALLPTLRSLGLTNEVDNGLNKLLITGYFPISNLIQLNTYTSQINFVRAVYTPILNAGTVLTQGDSAQGTDVVRNGWGLKGAGLKIGILSDSYNNLLKAQDDVSTGNLPADVVVLKDYPSSGIFFNQLDEGRAMAQIVHDIVPEADLFFHTGIISSGDFASGILKLGYDFDCDLIVDDITHITEPYFQDGIVARAVDSVYKKNVYYATSAGNFGNKSYESVSSPVTFNISNYSFLPNDNTLRAHNFGGGDIMQSLSMMPGRYLIKFEWDEPFATLKQATGATTNFDIWVVADNNQLLYSGNRNNIGEDPQEFMAFSVPGTTAYPVNILITGSNMPSGKRLKYTLFRTPTAGFSWNDQVAGIEAGTIVGQANAVGAVAVGAVLYSNTPPYGLNVPTIASFSSRGGVPVNGQNRFKPDFTAPNGGNTTVNLGSPAVGSGYPFFGTSAAAPHNVGVAAQLKEAGKKYFGADWTPAELKSRMIAGAIDMGAPGYDAESGNGFVQANRILSEIANPIPILNNVRVNQIVVAGEEYTNLVLTADGEFFTPDSKILVRDDTIPTTFISNSEISAIIILNGDPEISVYTPAKVGTTGPNGGTSVPSKIFNVDKTIVTITSNDTSKYYLQQLPEYTYTAVGLPEGVTLESLGLEIVYDAPATVMSNVSNSWQIVPKFASPPSVDLTELYDFRFPAIEDQGKLTILPLGIRFTPEDITGLYYGDTIPAIQSRIEVTTPGVVIDQELLDEVVIEYESLFSPDVDYAVANASRSLANASRSLANASRSLANGTSWLISGTAVINQSRSLANASRSLANASRSLANGNTVVDIDTQLIEAYQETPGGTDLILNASRSLANASRSLANAQILATGDFNLLTNASRSLANTSGLINAELFNEESNSEVVFIFDKDNTDLDGGANLPVTNIYPIHLVTGLDVTSDEDFNHCWVLPGAYISNGNDEGYFNTSNFIIDYGQGEIQILPAPLTVIANDSSKVYGTNDPVEFTYTISEDTPLVLDDVVENVFTGSLERAVGEDVVYEGYAITGGTLNAGQNYDLTVVPGIFTISPAALTVNVVSEQSKVYGEDDPVLAYTSIGLVGDDSFTGALTREEGEDVGDYTVTIGDLSAGSNYTTTLTSGGIFAITPAALTVSVVPGQSKIYGQDDLVLAYTSIGLVGDDVFTGALIREEGEDVGDYAVTIGDLSAGSNYTTTLTSGGIFAITPAALTVNVVPGQSKIYGDDDPVLEYSSIGLVAGDGFVGALARESGENVGDYNVSIGSLSAGSNYSTTIASGGIFTITPVTLTVTVLSGQTKVYGQNDPDFMYTSLGLIGNDTFTGALAREAGDDVGEYEIQIGDLSAGTNYEVSFIPANLTITQASLSVTAANTTKIYGQNDPVLAYTVNGLKNGDNASIFTGALGRQSGENVGTYSINAGNLNPGINYTMTFTPANLTITKASLTVRADDKDYYIYYGGKNKYFQFDPLPVWTSTITGLTNGDTEQSVFSSAATYKIQQTIFTGPGTFSITPLPRSMYSPQNYNVTYVKGALYVKVSKTNARTAAEEESRAISKDMNSLDEVIQFNAYPNPVTGILFVDMNGRFIGDVTVQIVDVQGKIYDSRVIMNPSGSRMEIDMTGMSRGMYMVKLGIENDMKMIKIVKQ